MSKIYQYPKLNVTLKTGNEKFSLHGKVLDNTLLDFWRWYASDLVNNTIRGVLAEYIVACALGLEKTNRIEWNAYDLVTSTGIKIEVKSAAYLQSWNQEELSAIKFTIKPTHKQQEDSNNYELSAKRQADVYVFCVLHHKVQDTLDPLDLNQWEFYVLPATTLNEKIPAQKEISLKTLLNLAPTKATFEGLAEAVSNLE